jgi:hypothetical protein
MIFFKDKSYVYDVNNFTLNSTDWVILDINGKYSDQSEFKLSRRIQLTRPDGVLYDFWLKDKIYFRNSLNHQFKFSQQNYIELWNSSHLMIRSMIESFKASLAMTPSEGVGLTREDQALQWLKVTIENIQKAIEHCLSRPEKFGEATLFMGTRAPDQGQVIRLLVFNLDFIFQFEGERGLAVLVYDESQKVSKAPDGLILQTYFKQLHLPVYDQLIQLLQGFGRLWNEPLIK